MRNLVYITAILLVSPNYGYASWFENCEFKASVVSEVIEDELNKKFKMEVFSAKSLKGSYTDCKYYISTIVEVEITHKEAARYNRLAKGETIKIYRTASDAITEDGGEKTFVEFRSRQ